MPEPKYECPDHPPEAQCYQEGTLCDNWRRVDAVEVPIPVSLGLRLSLYREIDKRVAKYVKQGYGRADAWNVAIGEVLVMGEG
jgi:hypothetical protein